ncbi:MAG TPA: hypothetical protein VF178_05355 [Gemmatimonadaceae bacterium]
MLHATADEAVTLAKAAPEPPGPAPAFSRLAELAPRRALSLLFDDANLTQRLPRQVLLPLLQSPSHEVRETAIQAIAHLR